MSKFPELTDDEIIAVLLHGERPRGYGYSIQDYVDEWNERVANGTIYQLGGTNNES